MPDTFASRLRRLREARGLSLPTLARLTGLSKQGAYDLETDGANPSIDTLYKVARALKVHPWELLPGWDGPPPAPPQTLPAGETAARPSRSSTRPAAKSTKVDTAASSTGLAPAQPAKPAKSAKQPGLVERRVPRTAAEAAALVDDCVTIMKHDVVGREETLAMSHLGLVRKMLERRRRSAESLAALALVRQILTPMKGPVVGKDQQEVLDRLAKLRTALGQL